jgi:hypothetical protein
MRLAAAFSLHAHTHYSRESMVDVSPYFDRIPILGGVVRRELAAYERRNRVAIDFSKVWWHPPLDPIGVVDSEQAHIARALGIVVCVSITDHDTIAGNLELCRRRRDAAVPISLEWSVPFAQGLFHLGVHNLPPRSAQAIVDRLNAYTRRRGESPLGPILDDLAADPGVLVVLNHPLWDLAGVGATEHVRLLRRFLNSFGDRVHAFELNGYRSCFENAAVRTLAEHYPLPLISGGDRHGCDPNALVNLSDARTFAEFVAEIRLDRRSVVAILRPYRRSLVARKLSTAFDAMREYPSWPEGRRRWTDRVEWDDEGVLKTMTDEWPDGGPWWVRTAIGTFRVGVHCMTPAMRALVWMAGASRSHEPGPAAGLTQLSAPKVSGESL